jgi:arylsulfatase A-like enzyme
MFVNDQYVKPQIPLDVIPDGWGSDAEIPETGGIPRSALLKRDDQLVREPEYYIAQYDGCIKYVDNAFAELVARLNKLGIYDDCLLMITSDHGEAMGENNVWFYHGLTVTPDQIHVPLMIKPHQGWNIRPKTIETPVSHVDLFPTISELVGLTVPGSKETADPRQADGEGTDRALESRRFFLRLKASKP